MAGEQKHIDFNLGAAFRAVEALQLSGAATAVFKAILSCGPNSFPSVKELARRTGFCKRTIKRIIRSLSEKTLVEVHKRYRPDGSHTSNRYVATASIFDPPMAAPSPGGGGDTVSGGGDTVSPGWCHNVTPHHKPIETPSKPHGHGDDGISGKTEGRPGLRPGGRINWRRSITIRDLSDAETVEELFGIAVGQLPGTWRDLELDRITFFGLAIVAREKNNPGGWFSAAIAGKWSSFVRAPVEDRARRAVKQLIHG